METEVDGTALTLPLERDGAVLTTLIYLRKVSAGKSIIPIRPSKTGMIHSGHNLRGRGVSDPEILSRAPTLVGAESKDPSERDPSTRPAGSLRVSPSRKTPGGLKYLA